MKKKFVLLSKIGKNFYANKTPMKFFNSVVMCCQCIITLMLLFLAVIRSQVNELPILLTLMNINLLISYIYVIINYRYIFRNHNSEKSVASFNFLNVFEKAKNCLFVGTAVYIMFITYTIVQIYNNE